MRYAPRAILAGGLGFAVSFVVACGGSSGLLSGDQSIGLSGQADQIASAVRSGNCGAAINASVALNRAVQTLPATLNPTLRVDLSQGASTIARLAAKGCHLHVIPPPPVATHTSTSATTPSTSSTSTTSSSTTPTTPTTTTTSTTPTTATSSTGPGNTTTTTGGVGLGGGTTTGNGNGNSNGNGSGGAGPGGGNSSTPPGGSG